MVSRKTMPVTHLLRGTSHTKEIANGNKSILIVQSRKLEIGSRTIGKANDFLAKTHLLPESQQTLSKELKATPRYLCCRAPNCSLKNNFSFLRALMCSFTVVAFLASQHNDHTFTVEIRTKNWLDA